MHSAAAATEAFPTLNLSRDLGFLLLLQAAMPPVTAAPIMAGRSGGNVAFARLVRQAIPQLCGTVNAALMHEDACLFLPTWYLSRHGKFIS